MNATKLPLNSLKVLVLHLLHLQICLHTMLVYPQLLFGIPTWISTPILTEGSTGADVLGMWTQTQAQALLCTNLRMRSKIGLSVTIKNHLNLSYCCRWYGPSQYPVSSVFRDMTNIIPETFIWNLLLFCFCAAPKASGCQDIWPSQVYSQIVIRNKVCYQIPTAQRKFKVSWTRTLLFLFYFILQEASTTNDYYMWNVLDYHLVLCNKYMIHNPPSSTTSTSPLSALCWQSTIWYALGSGFC